MSLRVAGLKGNEDLQAKPAGDGPPEFSNCAHASELESTSSRQDLAVALLPP